MRMSWRSPAEDLDGRSRAGAPSTRAPARPVSGERADRSQVFQLAGAGTGLREPAMALNEHLVHAPPEAVFAVLADPRSYAYWVVGSEEIRDADRSWPAAGSRFHHTVKVGPLRLKDNSEVEDVRPGEFLQLKVKGRPIGTARVKIELERAAGGTRVTMIEDPADAASALMFNPLTHRLVRGRNARSLDRLAKLAEGSVAFPGDEPAAPYRTLDGNGAVQNPAARERREASGDTLTAVARGMAAGFAGAMAMSTGSPKESKPMGLRTPWPCMVLCRTIRSPKV